jgi:GNAT superfamily N-acetyltransferase
MTIRLCRDGDREAIFTIINAAAEAYRGVIPEDCFHAPYMGAEELAAEIAAGVTFWGYEVNGVLAGVMGIQAVLDVDLIRHAYVLPSRQRRGIGGALLKHLRGTSTRRILIGTWADATWAIDFYRRHDFEQVAAASKAALLKTYWTVPDRVASVKLV